ncbi:hypothetical protein [Plantactinospora endophytica]|uniref:Uncharacterized protein n=1 Tax=Plantactinospora endophytica TaxID=673535 RepID=A0ABQ4EEK3_9ACTN|nr:hypothetical protein [Plantactinospora endophytica]GIG93160.1 hypothetical protein Pen02_80960 [Plantactinospora endophytica]
MPAHMLPDPEQTAYFLGQITDRRGRARHGGMSWAMGRMHHWAIEASRTHAAGCQVDDCQTCAQFITALSLCAAVAQTVPMTPTQRARLAELHEQN